MNNSLYIRARRRRRGKKRHNYGKTIFLFLVLLIFLIAVDRLCQQIEKNFDESQIIAAQCKKAVVRGADRETVYALSDIMIRQLGKPYVYGAAGPDAFDCSGFIQYVYASINIKLPRVVKAQVKAGVTVEKADLKFGDIVFFSDDADDLTHAGIVGVTRHPSNTSRPSRANPSLPTRRPPPSHRQNGTRRYKPCNGHLSRAKTEPIPGVTRAIPSH
jgi:hypothetical protein